MYKTIDYTPTLKRKKITIVVNIVRIKAAENTKSTHTVFEVILCSKEQLILKND